MRRSSRRRVRWSLPVVAAAVAVGVLLPAAPAAAHDALVGSTPAAGSTVDRSPASVQLRFDKTVLGGTRGATALIVQGPGESRRHFETTCAAIEDRTVRAAVRLGAPGRYTVVYRVVSADGHPVSASFTFVSRASGGGSGSAAGPDCGVRETGPVTADSGTTGWVIGGIAGGVALLAIVGAVVAVVLRPRRASP